MKKLLFIFLLLPLLSGSQTNLDSLWMVWKDESRADTSRLKAISDFAWYGYVFSQPDSAFYFAQLQYDFAKSNELKKQMADALNTQGTAYYSQGDHVRAIDYYTRGLTLKEETGDKRGISNSLNNIGTIYMEQGDHASAIEYYTRSLIISEEIGKKERIPAILNNIGNIYEAQGDYSRAIEYYTRSLKINKEIGNKKGIANVLNGFGVVYENQGDYASSFDYYARSLAIKEEIGDKQGIALSLNNIGNIYRIQGDSAYNSGNTSIAADKYANAIACSSRGLDIREEIDYKQGIASSLNIIGLIYLKQRDYTKAITYTTRALIIAQEVGIALETKNASNLLYETYKATNQHKKALKMYELLVATKDSLASEANQKEVIRQEFKYNYDKKVAVANAKHEAAMQQQEAEASAKQKQQNIIIGAISGGLALVALFLVFVFNRLRITRRQKNEIGKQKEVIETAHKETEKQKEIIEETHKEITDSINYAKRLQDAILPSYDEVNKYLPNNFILFKPKDVVSGDFYWFEQLNGTSYIAAADCTGHGVPGAMVSVVCSNALNRSVNEFSITEPSKILDKTRELVIETFAKSGEDVKDGMDIALCAFNGSKVIYSGANNPLWIVRKTELLTQGQKEERSTIIDNGLSLIEHKANKQPIGLYQGMKDFTQEEIDLHPGDSLYFFTDGFADQFGGEKGKKFKYKPFKRFLIDLHTKPINERAQLISDSFENWRGELEQIDDVCVIGVKIE